VLDDNVLNTVASCPVLIVTGLAFPQSGEITSAAKPELLLPDARKKLNATELTQRATFNLFIISFPNQPSQLSNLPNPCF
jgi:hypothetical protein